MVIVPSISDLSSLDSDCEVNSPAYLLSNEFNREQTKKRLSEIDCKENGVHIGFSCWENLDIMAVRKSCGGIVADISKSAYEAMVMTAKRVCEAANRFEFVQMIKKDQLNLKEDTDIDAEIEREGSWLASDDSFRTIQNLFKEGRVAILRLDVRDREKFAKIGSWLSENKLECDTLYVSNILDWIHERSPADMFKVRSALSRVLKDRTTIIISSEHFQESAGLPQRVLMNCRQFDPKKALFECKAALH